jgi:DNA-binding NarL/FixJ family response regulator
MMQPLRVAIFDDILWIRQERFHIPGLDVDLYADADDAAAVCADRDPPGMICMDFSMGADHADGAEAIRAIRAAGYTGRIVAMSSDPSANEAMIRAGADEALPQKAMLRSFLVDVAKKHEAG